MARPTRNCSFRCPIYDVQGIISYGYDEQVLFFTDVTLPPELAPGAHSLQASVSWLVCEVMCIPGSAELSLPVEILASDAAAPQPSAAAPFFDHFASQHPSSPVSLKGVGLESAI